MTDTGTDPDPISASSAPPDGADRAQNERRRRWPIVLGATAVVALVVLGGVGLWLRAKIDPSGGPGEVVRVEIPLGSSTADVAAILEDKGVITDGTVFRLYLRAFGGGPFQAGAYDLQVNSAMGDVVDVLDEGPLLPPAVSLTVPEALVVEEVAARVASKIERFSADRFLELARSGTIRSRFQPAGNNSLEGLLFPETYRVEDTETEETLLRRMVAVFDDVAGGLGYEQAQEKVGFSPYEVIIVASLIEAEAKADEDRGKIARVIYNRLEQGIPLGIDATFYFYLGPERKGTGLRRSDLDEDHEYNTRLRAGLVPTPIAMPGEASLRAALAPEPGPWLYYVLQDARTHAFSESYDEFLRNKRAAQEKGLIP